MFLVVGVLASAGCTSTPEPKTAKAPDAVTYLTAFGAFGRDAYAWVAQTKGFFREANLTVDIQLGKATSENLKLLKSNQVQFAAIDFSGAIVQAGSGNTWYRAINAVQQSTLVALMTLDDREIKTPKDLEGRTIAQATGAVQKTLFPMYATLAGVDASKVKWVDSSPQQLPALLAAGTVDVIGQFVVGQPTIKAAAGGREPVVLAYSEYLGDLYGICTVAANDYVDAHPDITKRFNAALLKGLQYTMDNPDEAGRILHAAQATTDPKVAAEEIRIMARYVSTGPGAVGSFSSSRVARAIASLQAGGLFPNSITPDQVVDFRYAPTTN